MAERHGHDWPSGDEKGAQQEDGGARGVEGDGLDGVGIVTVGLHLDGAPSAKSESSSSRGR